MTLPGFPARPTTRFAPAPTGFLHLGHVVNALYVWGIAEATAGRVVLRIEDHDRGRCRPEYERALLEDLDWLGFEPWTPSTSELGGGPSPYRQSDSTDAYVSALGRLREEGLVYRCGCSRSTFRDWAPAHGHPWRGRGCPLDCRRRGLSEDAGPSIRVALGDGEESFEDLLVGRSVGLATDAGDLLVRDRGGNWTYPFCVVVDDIRHDVDLVVRGVDLLAATPPQLRLARLLGRRSPAAHAHHALARKPSGAKLSKADGDTAIRELRGAGWPAGRVLGEAAAAVGLVPPGREVVAADAAEVVYDALARPTTARMSAP